MTFTETDNFPWSTNGNKITINVSGEDPGIATYSISGNKPTITDGDVVTVLTKQ